MNHIRKIKLNIILRDGVLIQGPFLAVIVVGIQYFTGDLKEEGVIALLVLFILSALFIGIGTSASILSTNYRPKKLQKIISELQSINPTLSESIASFLAFFVIRYPYKEIKDEQKVLKRLHRFARTAGVKKGDLPEEVLTSLKEYYEKS